MNAFWTLHAPATLALVLPVLMMPGLDFAAVARNAVGGGRRAGVAAAAGSTVGASAYILGAATGMGVVTDLVPGAEAVFRVLGSVVLWWFAWRFLSAAIAGSHGDGRSALPARSRAAFRDGALASVLNPKTPLFFAAVFGASGAAQAGMADRIAFGALVCVLHFAWFSGVALVLDRIGARPGSGPFMRVGAALVAVILAAAGFWAIAG
ncbi:LysE family transporter [Halovulum dunhuangense]|uniref:LysE family transporter n=1 Tax=Halovulum dunhuangense TaxID=1505036 RepID=A0A849L2I3_9RHOB|nr:LysE family transporter [Halovulum dunhuangense]NNU80450.1 LysE family transporter [Halovulum dunhuangense]